jgi:hypothetical protein
MMTRNSIGFLLVAACLSMASSYATPNFVVHAPNAQIAKQVGEYAERYRREKALEWIGREMPTWGQKCPLKVKVTPGGAGGATTFAFHEGAILEQEMNVEGSLDRILDSVLPHEITHTVFAYHFRCPLPRWADEGGSVLSEDDKERRRHDQLVRQSLASGRAFRLRTLLNIKDYPPTGSDIVTLYAQGYSVSRYVVERTNRTVFLNFIGDGMRQGWDYATKRHLGLDRVEDLEKAWLTWMRAGCPAETAAATTPAPAKGTSTVSAFPTGRPIEPGRNMIVRGASPEPTGRDPQTSGTTPAGLPASDGWSPVGLPQGTRRGSAQLLPPKVD